MGMQKMAQYAMKKAEQEKEKRQDLKRKITISDEI
jgi:hypothetical protein